MTRANLPIPLNLVEVRRLAALWSDNVEDSPDVAAFGAAARFYQRALIAADSDPEVAYLHFITSGEILSQAYLPQRDDRLLDPELEASLATVTAALKDEGKLARALRRRLFEVKRRYVSTFTALVDAAFFKRREAGESYGALQEADFEAVIGAAYDLRSQNVHRGEVVGHWMRSLHSNNEIQLGRPVVKDAALARTLRTAPTLIGLERGTRYVLLRFAEARLGVDLDVTPDEATV